MSDLINVICSRITETLCGSQLTEMYKIILRKSQKEEHSGSHLPPSVLKKNLYNSNSAIMYFPWRNLHFVPFRKIYDQKRGEDAMGRAGCGGHWLQRVQQYRKSRALFGRPDFPCAWIAPKWNYSSHREMWLDATLGGQECASCCDRQTPRVLQAKYGSAYVIILCCNVIRKM